MHEILSSYIPAIGMSPVSVITTIFGGFCVAFVAIICWENWWKILGQRAESFARPSSWARSG